jgi:hypothetical protein
VFVRELVAVDSDVVIQHFGSSVVDVDFPFTLDVILQWCPSIGTVSNFELLSSRQIVVQIKRNQRPHLNATVPYQLENRVTPVSIFILLVVVEYVLYTVLHQYVLTHTIIFREFGELYQFGHSPIDEFSLFAPSEEYPKRGEIILQGDLLDACTPPS